MGAAGPAMIFVCTLVLATLVFTLLAAYASHCFLVVVVDTSAGNDAVSWPKEPYKDWLWKPLYLTWLIAFWLMPVGLILRIAKPTFLADTKLLQFIAFALPGLWLFLPITLLSSASATSRWVLFRPAIVRGLMRFPASVLGFY